MTSHISTLQQQVETLFANLNFLRSQVDTAISTDSVARASGSVSSPGVGSATHGAMSRPPRFHGPTSSAFNLGVAKTSLRNIGITGSEDVPGEQQHHDRSPGASPPPIHSMPAASSLHDSKDPIWSITREEATRLVQSWKEHVYTMYPIVDINNLMQHIDQLYTFMEGAQRTGLVMTDLPGADAISDVETNKLKLILASAITMESNGPSELGEKLFRSVADRVESLLLQPPGLRNIEQMMLAVSVFGIRYQLVLIVRPFTHSIATMRYLLGVYSVSQVAWALNLDCTSKRHIWKFSNPTQTGTEPLSSYGRSMF